MKSYLKFIALASIGCTLTACQPVDEVKNSTDAQQPTTQAEKLSSMEDSMKAFARVESVVALLADDSAMVNDDVVAEMKKKLEEAKCHISYHKLDITDPSREGNLEISGVGCPVQASYQVSFKTAGDTSNYDLIATFLIDDQALKARNDIYKLNLSGKGQIRAEESKLISSLKITGNLTSASKGTISFTATQNDKKNAVDPTYWAMGTTKYSFSFPTITKIVDKKEVIVPGYLVEFSKKTSIVGGKDGSTFSLSNLPIDRTTYMSYIENLGLLSLPN